MGGLVSTAARPPVHGAELSEPGYRYDSGRTDGAAITFDLASEEWVFDAAFRLVHDQYVRLGYMPAAASGRRLSVHNALPTTRVFVARRGSEVVATVTLIVDSPIGLPMDEIYGDELGSLRRRGRTLAEVSALAAEGENPTAGGAVVLSLIRMVFLYATELAGVDDLCIAVNPRHAHFYQKLLHFIPLGGLRSYARVNDAPAVAFRADLASIEPSMGRARENGLRQRAIYDFLFAAANRDPVLARLRSKAPYAALTRRGFHRFLGDGVTLDRAGAAAAFVRSLYGPEDRSRRGDETPVPSHAALDESWTLPSLRWLRSTARR